MGRRKPKDPKEEHLLEHGALNPRPEDVTDPLFVSGEFFDPRDIVQVKYEMVRKAQVEGEPVNRCAASFGFSRPSFYAAKTAFAHDGLPGLVPKKRGPRGRHKLSEEVLAFASTSLKEDATLSPEQVATKIEKRFGIKVHPRSVQRALGRREKKRQ